MENVKKVYKILNDINNNVENENAFKKHFDTLSDFDTSMVLFEDIIQNGFTYCFMENVKNFYKKHGFQVINEGVNYRIQP